MKGNTIHRKKIIGFNYVKLIASSIIISIICCLICYTLKHLTGYMEKHLYEKTLATESRLFIFLPSIGITVIYFLRKYFFQNKKNKGITEIYTTLETRKDHLPFFKIPSHYFNGFLTLLFGGSTGVEVSTVVVTATV